jgi:hypothetical protein
MKIFGIFIFINNYFHDVATALLISSAFIMWVLYKNYNGEDEGVSIYFIKSYDIITKFAKFSLIWIIIGGIPRTIAYKKFEWSEALGKGQITALIVKHILMGIAVILGIYLWAKLHKIVSGIKIDIRREI